MMTSRFPMKHTLPDALSSTTHNVDVGLSRARKIDRSHKGQRPTASGLV